VFEGFEHEYSGPLSHYKAVSALVERPTGLGRGVVSRAHGLHRTETGKTKRGDRGFTTAGDHDVGIT